MVVYGSRKKQMRKRKRIRKDHRLTLRRSR